MSPKKTTRTAKPTRAASAKKRAKTSKAAREKPAKAASDRFIAAGHTYLPEMYRDGYFPDRLVDKVKALLVELVAFLDAKPRTVEETQAKCDAVVEAINELQNDFADAGSEIETVARDSIGVTVGNILSVFGIPIDVETAIGNRDW